MTLRRDPTGALERVEKLGGVLHPGDFVVHQHHGVGRFLRMETREHSGVAGEFFVLEYADGDKLFVPAETGGQLERYNGPREPALSQLGSSRTTASNRPLELPDPPFWRFRSNAPMTPAIALSDEEYELLSRHQSLKPVPLHDRRDERGRRWWWFKNEFYWDDEPLTDEQVHGLLADRLKRRDARIERTMSSNDVREEPGPRRAAISDEVKIFVWRRDQGRCVRCQSQQDLEFDHVVPVSMGGSNTARNIQILCAVCNRAKGGDLT